MNDTINQVGAGAPAAWTKTKPAAPGAYWIRGEGEGMLDRTALVEVVNFEGELWCNLHMRNTDHEFGYGYTVEQLDEAFEWLGPLVPAVQAEQDAAVYWVLFDAAGPVPYIKKSSGDGFLAFFDNEEDAKRAKRQHHGVDYKRVEYFRAPPAHPDAALVEALRNMLAAFDSPIARRKLGSEFSEQAIESARDALAGKGGE